MSEQDPVLVQLPVALVLYGKPYKYVGEMIFTDLGKGYVLSSFTGKNPASGDLINLLPLFKENEEFAADVLEQVKDNWGDRGNSTDMFFDELERKRRAKAKPPYTPDPSGPRLA